MGSVTKDPLENEYLIRELSTGCCFNHFRNDLKVYTELHPFRDLEKVQIHQPNRDKFRDNEILSFECKKLTLFQLH